MSPESPVRKLRPTEVRQQLDHVASALEQALSQGQLASFYETLRSTDLPFLGFSHAGDARTLYRFCFDILHRLGSISPAVALALENHLYLTAALATLPLAGQPALDARRGSLLETMASRRWLIANTNSRVHADKLATLGTHARREGDGFRISGTASYLSLASESDLLVFVTQIENEGPAIFVTPLKGNPAIEIGSFLFPHAMLDSDTRRVTFNDLPLSAEGLVLHGQSEQMAGLFTFQLIWHQALVAALYLGAASRAIEEARLFLRSVRTKDDRPLAELDGMIVDVGRLAIHYRAACCVVHQAGAALANLARRPLRPASLSDASDLASAAKYEGTRCAEEIVTEVRRVIGARAFTGGHPLERISQEVIFGTLGPEVSAFIERRYGNRVLGKASFLDQRW